MTLSPWKGEWVVSLLMIGAMLSRAGFVSSYGADQGGWFHG